MCGKEELKMREKKKRFQVLASRIERPFFSVCVMFAVACFLPPFFCIPFVEGRAGVGTKKTS